MAANYESKTSIEDLPDELITKILHNLPRNEIVKCFLINSRWANVINNCSTLMRRIPTKLLVSQHERAWKMNHQFVRNYRILELYGNNLDSMEKIEGINLEYVEYLQLSYCQIVSSSLFRSLLRRCKKLKFLSIESVKINIDDDDEIVEENAVRHLDFLQILNYINNFDVPLMLLKAITCERLTPKVLEFQTFTTKLKNGLTKFQQVLTHLKQHYTIQLKRISLINSCDEVLHVAMDILSSSEFRLQKLEIQQIRPEYRSEAFENFLSKQSELTYFKTADCLSEWQLDLLTKYLQNLTHLSISIKNCDQFNRFVHRLEKLEKLEVRAIFQEGDLELPKNLETFHMSSMTHPSNKTRTNFLLNAPMVSLKALIIRDGYISKEEIGKFFKYCPNVEHLEMTGFGAEFEVLSKSGDTATEYTLANWKNLRSVKLDKIYLNDDILTLIESVNLRSMSWMIFKQEQLIELTNTVQRGLEHLAARCPRLDVIQNTYSGTIYQRNKDTGYFDSPDFVRWYHIPEPFYIES